jgi:hypothetical protein
MLKFGPQFAPEEGRLRNLENFSRIDFDLLNDQLQNCKKFMFNPGKVGGGGLHSSCQGWRKSCLDSQCLFF